MRPEPPKSTYRYEDGREVNLNWQKWFAWKPVYINDEKYWMQIIYRRRCMTGAHGSPGFHPIVDSTTWIYGTILDVMKEPK